MVYIVSHDDGSLVAVFGSYSEASEFVQRMTEVERLFLSIEEMFVYHSCDTLDEVNELASLDMRFFTRREVDYKTFNADVDYAIDFDESELPF